MQDTVNRHDLVYMKTGALPAARAAARAVLPDTPPALIDALFAPQYAIPGFVCRQEKKEADSIKLGFSSWRRWRGGRVRASAPVPEDGVERILTPYEAADAALHAEPARWRHLQELLKIAASHGLQAGIFGSTALQLLTGLPYLSPTSDVDLLVEGSLYRAVDFLEDVKRWEATHRMRTDIEIRLADGWDVKLRELVCGSATVLAKCLYQVALLDVRAYQPTAGSPINAYTQSST